MIVDWYNNCKKIHRSKLINLSGQDKRHKIKQEIVYLAFLRDHLHFNNQRIFKEWKKIKNGVAALFATDTEQQLIEFYHLYKKSSSEKYTKLNYSRPLDPINIYEEEINFLNSLEVPLWVKQYWLSLLFYYKFACQSSHRVQISSSLNNWAINNCTAIIDERYSDKQDLIAKYKIKIKKPIINYLPKTSQEHYNCYEMSFLQNNGRVLGKYKNINQINDAIKLLKETLYICPKCGCKFIKSSRSKTDLCPECYKTKRKEDVAKNVKKNYYKNISSNN